MGDDQNKKIMRPLPSRCPTLIPVEIRRSEHGGRKQWVSSYPFYNNGKDSDWVDIVINFGRFTRHQESQLVDGQRVWVRPTAMAPHARLIFADFVRVDDRYDVGGVFPHQVDEEIDVPFVWRQHDQRYVHQASDGWFILMANTDLRLAHGEVWKVRVLEISHVGEVIVGSVGPSDYHVVRALPVQLAYLQVKSLYGKPLALEGDVLAYTRWSGDEAEVAVRVDDDVVVFSVRRPRQQSPYDDTIIGTVTLDNHRYGQLCELVWVEGQPVSETSVSGYRQRRRKSRPTRRERVEDQASARERELWLEEEAEHVYQDYLDEIRFNSERPDYD